MKAACRKGCFVTLALAVIVFGQGLPAIAQEADQLKPIPEQTVPAPETQGITAANNDCCNYCDLGLCSPPGRIWLRADYLMWWTSGTVLPPLVTSDALSENPTLYYGSGTYLDGGRSGVHTTIGTWLDPCHIWNFEVDYLTLGQMNSHFNMSSDGSTQIARPFYNIQDGEQDRQWISYPDTVSGNINIHVKDYFQSAGALLSYQLCSGNCCNTCNECECEDPCGPPRIFCCRTDLLGGFRYYNLSDSISIHESLDQTRLGLHYELRDDFMVQNDFYGGELGLRTQIYRGRWSLELLTKLAIGNTHRIVKIGGETTVSNGTDTNTYSAGLLTSSNTNSDTYNSDAFTIIPQLNAEIGYQLTRHWRAYIGYSILYWGNIMRSADEIDLQVDPRNLSVPPVAGALPFPAYQGRTSSFWAQGINLGTEFRF